MNASDVGHVRKLVLMAGVECLAGVRPPLLRPIIKKRKVSLTRLFGSLVPPHLFDIVFHTFVVYNKYYQGAAGGGELGFSRLGGSTTFSSSALTVYGRIAATVSF